MNVTIEPSASRVNCYNLYVNGNIAVSLESMAVCEKVKEAILRPSTRRSYSEGAEVADRIREVFAR